MRRREAAAGGTVTVPGHGTSRAEHLGDFALRPRVLLITALALAVGAASGVTAFCLLRLIGLITNAVFYQRFSA
ncbi:MAG TPA: hypothetical protein VF060_18940, partial [Trebonia sp.]